jgi:hypothetical protein
MPLVGYVFWSLLPRAYSESDSPDIPPPLIPAPKSLSRFQLADNLGIPAIDRKTDN